MGVITKPFLSALLLLFLLVAGCHQDEVVPPEDQEAKPGLIASFKGFTSDVKDRIVHLFNRQKTSPEVAPNSQAAWRMVTINFNFQNYDNRGKLLGTIDDVRITISADSDEIKDVSSQLRSGSSLKVRVPKNFSGNLTISAEKENYRLEQSVDASGVVVGFLTVTENDNDYTVTAQFQKHQREMRAVSVQFEFQNFREDGKYLGTVNEAKITVSSSIIRKSHRLRNKDILSLQIPADFAGYLKIDAHSENFQLRTPPKPLNINPGVSDYTIILQFEEPPPVYHFTFSFSDGTEPIPGCWVELTHRSGTNKVRSRKSNAKGQLGIDMTGYINDQLQIVAHHDILALPAVKPYKLMEERYPAISLKVEILSLRVQSRTSDGGQISEPITIIAQATEQQVALSSPLTMSLGQTQSIQFLKPANNKVKIIGQIKDNSKYDDAVLLHTLSSINLVTLNFSPSSPYVIQILCRDEKNNPLKRVQLSTGTGGEFVEKDNGSYLHQGYAREGRQVSVVAEKEGYIFEKLPLFTVRSDQQIQKTITAQLGPIHLSFSVLEERTKTPIQNVTLRVSDKSVSTDSNGVATLQIPAQIDVTIPLKILAPPGYEGPYWANPGDSDKLRITADRNYTLKTTFRRLPRLLLKTMDARQGSKAITEMKLLDTNNNVLGETGANGQLNLNFPKSTGRFLAKLSADGYLEEEYNIKVPMDSDEYSDTRYLLPISPLVYRMGFATAQLEIGLNSSLIGEKIKQEKLKQRIINILMRQLDAVNSFSSAGEIGTIDVSNPNWHRNLDVDYLTVATLSDLGSITNRRLTVDIYDTKGDTIVVSAFAEQFELLNLQSKIQTRIIPQLLASLPVVGYVVGQNRGGVVLNIGNELSVNSGDIFDIENIKRNPQGKVLSENKIQKLKVQKGSVKKNSSVLTYSGSQPIGLGSLAIRQPTLERSMTLHVEVAKAKVYWKPKETENWQFAGTANNVGDIEFEAPQEAFDVRVHAEGAIAEKSYRRGMGKTEDYLKPEISIYSLRIETVPAGSQVKIYGGIGQNAKWLNDGISGEEWQCSAGSYKIEVIAPNESYRNKTALGLIPVLSSAPWDGTERSSMVSPNQAVITIHLPIDYLTQIKTGEQEGKTSAEIIKMVVGIKKDDPDYREAMLLVGEHAQKIPDIEKAIEIYKDIIQVSHLDPFAHYHLGEIFSRPDTKNYQDAIIAYQDAFKYLGYLASTSSRLLLEHNIRLGIAEASCHQEDMRKFKSAFLTYEDLYNRLEKSFAKSDNPGSFIENKAFFDDSYQKLKNLMTQETTPKF